MCKNFIWLEQVSEELFPKNKSLNNKLITMYEIWGLSDILTWSMFYHNTQKIIKFQKYFK